MRIDSERGRNQRERERFATRGVSELRGTNQNPNGEAARVIKCYTLG